MTDRNRGAIALGAAVAALFAPLVLSAQSPYGVPVPEPPADEVVLATAEIDRVRVVPVVSGLDHPWGMAFRANGDVLVTERERGTLRLIRDGQLVARPIEGVPEVYAGRLRAGLMDVAVHPADDALVYLTYSKPVEWEGNSGFTVALARGRLEGARLTGVTDLFVVDGLDLGIAASKLLFAPDGTLFMSVGGSYVFAGTGELAQDPGSHFGKLLRLNADGSVPSDNPFVGRDGYRPEIFSMGHRNQLGLALHPGTGELWATENGPQGGDEANVIRSGANYGWPLASYSREYPGRWVSETPWRPEFEGAEVLWWPSIAPAGLVFYTGDQFPEWQGDLFVGSMMVGRLAGTGHLERIVFNQAGEEVRREWLLADLKQRVRDVRQGPDGYLYVLTEQRARLGPDVGALLRIEPAHALPSAPGSAAGPVPPDAPRIGPIPESGWSSEQRALVERFSSPEVPRNAVTTLARVPALAERVLPFVRYLATESTLEPRHRMMLILRTAWLTRSESLWTTYAPMAGGAGLGREEQRRIAEGPTAGWDAHDAALIRLADELFHNSAIREDTWAAATGALSLHQSMDAVATVAQTTHHAILLNALGVQPDPGAEARMPTGDVRYRIAVEEREPYLAAPRVEPVEGRGLRVTRTFARHPELAGHGAGSSYTLNPERSRLTPHDRELLILRTGWNAQAPYEWAKHVGSVGRAREHGLEPARIALGLDAPGWNGRERALIMAADELFEHTTISDGTWAALAEHYDEHQLMSIVATVGRYRMVSMTLNALGVQPLPTDEALPMLRGY